MQNRYDAQNPPALKRLLSQGVQLRPFPVDLMDAAKRESLAMLEEEAQKDAGYRAFTSTGRLTARRPLIGLAKRSLPTLRRPSVRPSPSPSRGLGADQRQRHHLNDDKGQHAAINLPGLKLGRRHPRR